MPYRSPRYSFHVRSGFILIEVLVALVLFEFAMLALAASAAVAARNLASANLGTRAQQVARNRVEELRVGSCSRTVGGNSHDQGVTEFWSIRAAGSVRVVCDSVEYVLPDGRRRRLVLYAHVLCPS